jgi:hypothetical protein
MGPDCRSIHAPQAALPLILRADIAISFKNLSRIENINFRELFGIKSRVSISPGAVLACPRHVFPLCSTRPPCVRSLHSGGFNPASRRIASVSRCELLNAVAKEGAALPAPSFGRDIRNNPRNAVTFCDLPVKFSQKTPYLQNPRPVLPFGIIYAGSKCNGRQ